ncbi:uncharacterized protein LOC119078070 [Bradysia coprophila]|uniref:uncharacterized protein LOC119078070 n=1 Tax=Bradysia coprophila TaxID=38358 RepID=UPI00187DD56B|nr:uncharacterized protein LOC119078070 [Bradysia coprophila]
MSMTYNEYTPVPSRSEASYRVAGATYPGTGASYPGSGASYPGSGVGYPVGGYSYLAAPPSERYDSSQGSGNYPGYTAYYPPPTNATRTPKIDFKQAFLHTLSTEIRLSQVIHPDEPLVIVRADLESFGPNIAHDAVLTVFEYFGVPVQWIEFFKKFLQPKVRFEKDEEPKKVVRGVPTSHVLSSLFEETLLFLLDFYVNQQCNGMKIYRLDNEFWFWSNITTSVNKAWNMMTKYGEVIGLKINENRSGSVTVYSDDVLSKMEKPIESTVSGPSPLPQKNIHWGYLQLYSNGTFVIDQKSINKFLEEMQRLLDESECALEWINIFNKYLEFFIRNFGKSALVSGKQHLDQIIDALRVIYEGLFGSKDGSPVEKLKERFEQLKAANIVDVWAYWPLERGGLGLVNPFIGIMSLRETYVNINDDDNFSKLPLQDKDLWEWMKKEHERQYSRDYSGPTRKMPTWTEYIATRETELDHWCSRYLRLLERPAPKTPTVSDRFWKLDAPIPEEEYEKNYMMWLFSYYETQLILHFGSVKFINSKLLPMSMIGNIQKTKLHQ